jgi:hypothetical protein
MGRDSIISGKLAGEKASVDCAAAASMTSLRAALILGFRLLVGDSWKKREGFDDLEKERRD